MASQPTYDQGKLKTHGISPFFPAGYEKPIFFLDFCDSQTGGSTPRAPGCWRWLLPKIKCLYPKLTLNFGASEMYPTKKQVASKHFFSNTKHAQITNLYLYLVVSTHVKNVRQLELGNLVQIGCEKTNLSKEKHLGDHLPFINESLFQ